MNFPVFNVFAFLIFLIAIIILHFFVEPIKRGFFCNDATIRMPYYQNASFGWISIWAVSFGLTFLLFTINNLLNNSMKMWRNVFADFIPFIFGFLINVLLSIFTKVSTGRLRPCFIEFCKPDVLQSQCLLTLNNSNSNNSTSALYLYLDVFKCTSSEYSDVFARSSFYSGRASTIAFSSMYLICYLQIYFSHLATFVRAFSQLSLLILAFLLSTSSLFDNHHFWDDIFVGFIVGTAVALYTFTSIRLNFDEEYDQWKNTRVLLNTHHSPLQWHRQNSSSVGQLSQTEWMKDTSERTPLTEEWHSVYQTL